MQQPLFKALYKASSRPLLPLLMAAASINKNRGPRHKVGTVFYPSYALSSEHPSHALRLKSFATNAPNRSFDLE